MSLTLTLKQAQKLSPSVIQLLSMLQMNSLELQSYVEELMQENPVFDIDPPTPVYDPGFYSPKRNALRDHSSSDEPFFYERPQEQTLCADLCLQLDVLPQSDTTRIAKTIAAMLDDNGYLAIEDYLSLVKTIGEKDAKEALSLLQSLSPTGVGARSLSECLLLQLRQSEQREPLAEEIILHHLDALSKGHYQRIAKSTKASAEEVRTACSLIQTLNPKPGSGYANSREIEFIIPDLFLDDELNLYINSRYTPKIKYNPYYRELWAESEDSEVKEYLTKKFQQAQQLASNIQTRSKTLLVCANIILEYQAAFFQSHGAMPLVPFTQTRLSELARISESTVSRTVNGKYIQCSFGTYPLSYFFTTAIEGTEQSTSADEIKFRIRTMVANEDKSNPLSDRQMVEQLAKEGVTVSRRAIAKYRSQLDIPGTLLRKEKADTI